MTTYYVGSGGDDTKDGQSYANRWLTIAKALGAAGIASGDTVYLTPGAYREVVAVAMTSATVETLVIGDVDGSHTSGSPGPVIWTGHTTNDTTAPAASAVIDLAARDFLTFRNIVFIAGTVAAITATTATCTDIKFQDCAIYTHLGGNQCINITVGAGVAANWTLDRCVLYTARGICFQTTLTRHTVDYDANIVIQNSVIIANGNTGVRVDATGAGAGFGGGVDIRNCTILVSSTGVQTNSASLATSIPCTVNNCLISGATGLSANTSGQITENYNVINAGTARTNVTVGANSQSGAYSPLLHLGNEYIFGQAARQFATPMSGSPLLGFGNDGTATAYDLLNRARPEGGASTSTAVGALERHDTAVKETSTTDAGGVGIKITGPGSHRFQFPVDAAQTTITVRAQADANHGSGTPPQITLLANGELGVATQTVTMTANTGTWNTVSLAAFTPTAKGVVTVELISRAAAGNGIAYFDTFTIA